MRALQTFIGHLSQFAGAFVLALTLPAFAQTAAPQEGKDYTRLANPVPVETGKKIEVIEFFSYGCPHCG